MPNIPLALVPGHIGTKSDEELRRDVIETTAKHVIENLTVQPAVQGKSGEPGARDIVFKGGFNAVNQYFYDNELSDGLPIVPPTREAIDEFLKFTDRDPNEVLGVILPDSRAATIWSIAVNGVMAGCKPEYLPVVLGGDHSVALGTVCDVVPLTGVNRALVRQGLQVMRQRRNAGLAALADVARLREEPGAYHLGFMLGPRVNAGGRVGQADLGARLLASDDTEEVGALALRLDEFNSERRDIEREVLDQAIARIEGLYGPDRKAMPSVLLVESEGWHVGVIGIVASRLVERYGRPAFVIGMDGELGKGSGRSVRGVDLGAAVIAARQEGLLVNGGGHAMAAGLTVARLALPDLAKFLDDRIAPQLGAAPAIRELGIDAALAPAAATHDLVTMIERAGPFGAGNALPRFAIPGVRVNYAQPVGEGHVRCTLVGQERGRVEAIAFRAAQTAVGPALLDMAKPILHVAGALRIDRYNGRESVRLQIDDVASAAGSIL